MRTYVINLARAVERRALIEGELAPTGLDYEVVEAVEGRALTTQQYAALVDGEAAARWPQWLTPGAIGCILSHRIVCERVAADRSGPALVLEDDARLASDFGTLVTALAAEVAPDEVLLLNFLSFEPCRLSQVDAVSVSGYRILRAIDPAQPISTLAYLVGEQAATRMAESIIPVRFAADSWGEYVKLGAISSLRCVMPRPVLADPDIRSTIRHGSTDSLRQRVQTVAFGPAQALRRANRYLIARRMTRVELID